MDTQWQRQLHNIWRAMEQQDMYLGPRKRKMMLFTRVKFQSQVAPTDIEKEARHTELELELSKRGLR